MQPSRVLWTSGWDSTFRVLELVLAYRAPVQPHYILYPSRPGALRELDAMRAIRQRLQRYDSEAARRLAPLHLVLIDDIPFDDTVAARLKRLGRRTRLGGQYDALARHAVRAEGLELCFEKHITGHDDDFVEVFLLGRVERVEDDRGGYWRLDPDIPADDDLVVFAPFRFPILDRTKVQLREEARRRGWLDIMAATRFCHRPRRKPCGWCRPCQTAMREGMRDRLPYRARAMYHSHRLLLAAHVWPLLMRVLRPQRA